MSSRSSSSRRPLPLGYVSGCRTPRGDLTVRVASGQASRWAGLERVLIGGDEAGEGAIEYVVENARAYRDRLVLKLRGVDDATGAQALKRLPVLAPGDLVPPLPQGEHYRAWLVGLEARDERGRRLGTVIDVEETRGSDLLVVREPDGRELLLPMTRGIVLDIREKEGWLTARLPAGLRELNRESSS